MPSRTASKRLSGGTSTYSVRTFGAQLRGDLGAEIDDVARRLAVLVAVGIGLGVGAVADPEHAAVAHPVERAGRGRLRRQDKGGDRASRASKRGMDADIAASQWRLYTPSVLNQLACAAMATHAAAACRVCLDKDTPACALSAA